MSSAAAWLSSLWVLEMLQKVVALLQNQDLVAEIVSSDNAAEAYSLVKDQLL